MQNQEKKTAGDIIRERREELTLTQKELGDRVGTHQQTIDKIESGLTKNSSFLPLIANVLGLELQQVMPRMARTEKPKEPTQMRDLIDQTQLRETFAVARDLPLHLLVEAGNGALVMSSGPIDRIERPSSLTHVKDAYAVIVVGDSMFPVLKPGYKVKVHPHIPPTRGDICVFINDANGEFHATIKEYVTQTKDAWKVKRYYPKEETILLRKREWNRCQVVVAVDYR